MRQVRGETRPQRPTLAWLWYGGMGKGKGETPNVGPVMVQERGDGEGERGRAPNQLCKCERVMETRPRDETKIL
jgi:hypothetical protein